MRKVIVAGLVLGFAGLLGSGAEARVEAEAGYTKAQTYSCALRYLRVDQGYEIVEKDADAAYLLFRYERPGRSDKTNGSVEIVDTGDDAVKLFVQLPRMPQYHEQVLRDGLLKKLREEYGEPPPRQKKPEKKPPADAGAD